MKFIEPEMPHRYVRERHQLARDLWDAGVARVAASDFHFDTTKMTDSIRRLAARCMGSIQTVKKLPCDAVLGVPSTGEPLAEAFAYCCWKKHLQLKPVQLGRRFAQGISISTSGPTGPGEPREVVLVDDQTKTGKIVAEAVDHVRNGNYIARHVIALFDWDNGAAHVLDNAHATLDAVYTWNQLLAMYVEDGLLRPEVRVNLRRPTFA